MSAQRNPRQPTPLTDHHTVHGENVRLRTRLNIAEQRLAGSERARSILLHELDAKTAECRWESVERRRLEGLTRATPTRRAQAVELAYDCIIVPVLALERVERRWRRLWASLTDPATKHDSWGAPIAAGICVAIFLIVALAVGK